jgi:hypothetical protein
LERPFPDRAADLFFILLFVCLIVGTGVYYYHPAPPIDYLNGVYKSACCPDVTIRHGEVALGSERAKMNFRYLKYGFVGSLDKPIGPLFHVEDGRRVPVDLLFHGNREFTTADYRWNSVLYRRTSSARTR